MPPASNSAQALPTLATPEVRRLRLVRSPPSEGERLESLHIWACRTAVTRREEAHLLPSESSARAALLAEADMAEDAAYAVALALDALVRSL